MDKLIVIEHMDKVFGNYKAIDDLSFSLEGGKIYGMIGCLEYLVYMGMLSDLSYDEALKRTKELLEEFDLVEHQLKRVAKFSTGMKKKVGLIQAMMHKPEILLLDEPTANLDPTSRYEIIQTLKRLVKQRKMTVLISSHVLTELEMN